MSVSNERILEWLYALKFNNELDGIWKIDIKNNSIIIDENKNEIIYPESLIYGRRTTLNLDSEENFVILEAIIGLLIQGYNPKNIMLEKGYRLGHNTKSGNADITVHDNSGKTFLIIEAKTYEDEFEKAWQETLRNGGQIFSYERQENTSEVIVLYSSTIDNGEVKRIYHAIPLIDNEDYLMTLATTKSYQNAKGGNDKFEVWKEIYQSDFLEKGVLETDIDTYTINKSKRTVKDLKKITHEEVQKKYNQFATILRKYNIGGRENAFDILVNLFLAKIVDEKHNADDLKFVWKGVAQDTYFDLVDRLEKLYQMGMHSFLNESVTYVSESDVISAFRMRQDAAKDAVLDYFRQIKYFSNNDFSFIEVYNEKLFYQNSKVLVEVIKLFEELELKSDTKNQFLGDLFEGFLDNGVKQSEGQFFTPLPIVKFIVTSLPLDTLAKNPEIPIVLDYASGAGHFLNEYAEQIEKKLNNKKLIPEYYSNVYGIEKEYRLSKVAKVSSFMYGQDEINIIYGDGLKKHKELEDNSVSLIIANPPYSVKGFLVNLTDNELQNYELSKFVNDVNTNNSIELFFVERAAQLLESEGIAVIILPVSILSNSTKLASEARKLILRKFEIIAITEFGSKTFGSTGQNTVTLFLRKRKYPPSESNHYDYLVERWFNNNDISYEDEEMIKEYCVKISVPYEVYKELQTKVLHDIKNYNLYKDYHNKFLSTQESKKIIKKKITNNYTEEDKIIDLDKLEIEYIRSIENEKVYYFALSKFQNTNVVVVKTKSDKVADMKKFLGYDWSKRRGQEGIKYIGTGIPDEQMEVSKNQAIDKIVTPLFNPNNNYDDSKVNSLIRANFNGEELIISEEIDDYVNVQKFTDLLDFSRSSFDANIKTVVPTLIVSSYPVKRLGSVVDVIIGGTPSRENSEYFTGDNLWLSISEMNGSEITDTKEKITKEAVEKSNVKLIPEGTPLLSFKLSIGKTAIAGKDLYTNEAIAGLIPKNDTEILNKYLFELFNAKLIDLENASRKAFGKSLNSEYIKDDIYIPVPPIYVQKEIVRDLDSINNEIRILNKKIESSEEDIDNIYENIDKQNGAMFDLNSNDFIIGIGKRVVASQLTRDGIPVFSANPFVPMGYINKEFFDNYSQPVVIWGIDGDWAVNVLPENYKFYPTDHLGVIKLNTENIDVRYLAHRLEQTGNVLRFTRSNRPSVDRIKNIKIQVPELSQQIESMDKVEGINNRILQLKNEIEELKTQKLRKMNNYIK